MTKEGTIFENLKDCYAVVTNGNELRFTDENKKPALRKALNIAKKGKDYVELWYIYEKTAILCDYWN